MEDKEAFEIVIGLAQDSRSARPMRSPEGKRQDEAILRIMTIADRIEQENLDD